MQLLNVVQSGVYTCIYTHVYIFKILIFELYTTSLWVSHSWKYLKPIWP